MRIPWAEDSHTILSHRKKCRPRWISRIGDFFQEQKARYCKCSKIYRENVCSSRSNGKPIWWLLWQNDSIVDQELLGECDDPRITVIELDSASTQWSYILWGGDRILSKQTNTFYFAAFKVSLQKYPRKRSMADLHAISCREGYFGGLRLLQATCKAFYSYCRNEGIGTDSNVNFVTIKF